MPDLRPRIWKGTAVIDEYARWVADYTAQGWDAYLATLMFDELAGSMEAQKVCRSTIRCLV